MSSSSNTSELIALIIRLNKELDSALVELEDTQTEQREVQAMNRALIGDASLSDAETLTNPPHQIHAPASSESVNGPLNGSQF